MKNVITIAQNTFKETIRDKILYVILAFAFLFLLSTTALGTLSLGEDIKVVKDLGLGGIYIFSLIITIFLGTSLIYKEIEKRTLYILLSKPVSRVEFLIGKFFGLWSSVILNVLLMSAVYLTIVAIKGGGVDLVSLWSILLLLFELSIFIALAIVFSTITMPLAGAIYSLIILYIGHSLDMIKNAAEKSSAFFKYLVEIAYYILPNLEKFNLRNSVVHGTTPSFNEIMFPVIYAILYSICLLWIASIALKNQDL